MPSWLEVFIAIATIAIVIQMAVLLGLFLELRQLAQTMNRVLTDLQVKVGPVLVRINSILEDSQGRIASLLGDGAEMTRIARNQAQKVDRVFTEAVDRLRLQVLRADHIITGALEVVDEAGSSFRKIFLGPVSRAAAVLKGLKVGLDFIRGIRPAPQSSATEQDEELFI